jgi:hypothetical protein
VAAVRAGEPLLWTGHGASFALARAFAESIELLGGRAHALAPEDCHGRHERVCLVSQSARDPGLDVWLLVTAATGAPSWTAAPRFVIPLERAESSEWMPLSFQRRALEAFRGAFALSPWDRAFTPDADTRSHVLLTRRHVAPLRALFEAARWKLDDPGLEAVSFDELGHGLHARLWRHPDRYRLRLLVPPGARAAVLTSVERWCAEFGVAWEEASLRSGADDAALPLELFDHGLAALQAACTARDIDWRLSPLPASADWLRETTAGRRGTPPRGA